MPAGASFGPSFRLVRRIILKSGNVRQGVETCYHPVGTCRMGTTEDCVVDEECRVRGIKGLRVVDASIMPEVPRANTHLTCVMIGEHVAAQLAGRT